MPKNYKKLSIEALESKLAKAQEDLKYFKDTLKMLPENTLLGRLGIIAEIKYTEYKISEIKQVIAERKG